jgi:hypothetical protein
MVLYRDINPIFSRVTVASNEAILPHPYPMIIDLQRNLSKQAPDVVQRRG